jgi:hypothetical protein
MSIELLVVIKTSPMSVQTTDYISTLEQILNKRNSSVNSMGNGIDVLFHYDTQDEAIRAERKVQDRPFVISTIVNEMTIETDDISLMYGGSKPFDREQLAFVAHLIFAGCADRIQSCTPPSVPVEDYTYPYDAIELVGIQLPILYAQLTGDGLGCGDFEEFVQFQSLAKEYVTKQCGPNADHYGTFPDVRSLAERFVDRMFANYLSQNR